MIGIGYRNYGGVACNQRRKRGTGVAAFELAFDGFDEKMRDAIEGGIYLIDWMRCTCSSFCSSDG